MEQTRNTLRIFMGKQTSWKASHMQDGRIILKVDLKETGCEEIKV
jgi:membrane glycosyltransferase